MLGDLVVEEQGQVTGMRVLPSEGGAPTVERTFQAMGKLLGVDMTNIGTYTAVVRPDGTLLGRGQGIVMGKAGEAATWTGGGVGRFTGNGGVSFRGAIYYQSVSPAWTRLNGVAVVFEHEVNPDGSSHDQGWEWK